MKKFVFIFLSLGFFTNHHALSSTNLLNDAELNSIRSVLPDMKSVDTLSKGGINRTFKVTSSDGSEYLVKFFTDQEENFYKENGVSITSNFTALHEAAASQLGSYITNKLVPAGIPLSGKGILYPFIKIDKEATQSLFQTRFPNFNYEHIYDKLTFRQRCQVFVHMIADVLLDNPDSHSGQFALSKEKIFMGFDKGRAYLDSAFSKKEKFSEFKLDKQRIEKSYVYSDFAKRLKNDKTELLKILSSDLVYNALDRIASLVNEEKALFQIMNPLLTYLETIKKPDEMKHIKESYIHTFSQTKSFLSDFFNLKEADFTHAPNHQEILEYVNEDGLHTVTFDPKRFHPRLLAPIEEQVPGEQVSKMIKRSGALAGINGGFFTVGDAQRWSVGWIANKINQKLNSGIGNRAFPSAILKTIKGLYGDTPDPIAAIGWSYDASKTAIGLLRVEWLLHHKKDSFKLKRLATPLNPEYPKQYFYLKKDSNSLLQFEIKEDKIQSINKILEIDMHLPNSYELLNQKNSKALSDLNLGDEIKIDYMWDESEVSSSDGKGFKDVDQVVSGGAILLRNFEIQSNFPSFNNPDTRTPRTALCITKDGRWKMFVTSSNKTVEDLASELKRLSCKDAINMDGGGSTTLYFSDTETHYGSNIVVSDSIGIMPEKKSSLGSLLYGEGRLFSYILNLDLKSIIAHVNQFPDSVYEKNMNNQTPFHSILKESKAWDLSRDSNRILEFLYSHMSQFSNQDNYGDTALHTALRNGHSEWARKILDKSSFDDLNCVGFRGQTPLDLLSELDVNINSEEIYKLALSHTLTDESINYMKTFIKNHHKSIKIDYNLLLEKIRQHFDSTNDESKTIAFKLIPLALNNACDESSDCLTIAESLIEKGLKNESTHVVNTTLTIIDMIDQEILEKFHRIEFDKIFISLLERGFHLQNIYGGFHLQNIYAKFIKINKGIHLLEDYVLKQFNTVQELDNNKLNDYFKILFEYHHFTALEFIMKDITEKSGPLEAKFIDLLVLAKNYTHDKKYLKILAQLINEDNILKYRYEIRYLLKSKDADLANTVGKAVVDFLIRDKIKYIDSNYQIIRSFLEAFKAGIRIALDPNIPAKLALHWTKNAQGFPGYDHVNSNLVVDAFIYTPILERPEYRNIVVNQIKEAIAENDGHLAAVLVDKISRYKTHFIEHFIEDLIKQKINNPEPFEYTQLLEWLGIQVKKGSLVDLGKQEVQKFLKSDMNDKETYPILNLIYFISRSRDKNEIPFCQNALTLVFKDLVKSYSADQINSALEGLTFSEIYSSSDQMDELKQFLSILPPLMKNNGTPADVRLTYLLHHFTILRNTIPDWVPDFILDTFNQIQKISDERMAFYKAYVEFIKSQNPDLNTPPWNKLLTIKHYFIDDFQSGLIQYDSLKIDHEVVKNFFWKTDDYQSFLDEKNKHLRKIFDEILPHKIFLSLPMVAYGLYTRDSDFKSLTQDLLLTLKPIRNISILLKADKIRWSIKKEEINQTLKDLADLVPFIADEKDRQALETYLKEIKL